MVGTSAWELEDDGSSTKTDSVWEPIPDSTDGGVRGRELEVEGMTDTKGPRKDVGIEEGDTLLDGDD